METFRQEDFDCSIIRILNIVMIETTSEWFLDNLTTADHWILSFTVDGEAEYYWKREKYKVKRGDTIFFQEGFSRSAKSSPDNPWKFIVIKFRLGEMNEKTKDALERIPNIIFDARKILENLFFESEAAWRGKQPGFVLQCKGILYSILYTLLRSSGQFYDPQQPYRKEMKKIMQMIGNNTNENYSVSQLAKIAGLSESYFRSLFKKYTGISIVQYQNYIKISRAKDLLLTGNYRVNQVAEMVGIHDVYYFSRLFKKITGVNPSSITTLYYT